MLEPLRKCCAAVSGCAALAARFVPLRDVCSRTSISSLAVEAREGETIAFSWIEWPSKQVRDDAWSKLKTDPRMQPDNDMMLFDGQRLIHRGLATILDA
jgi:uncharacterized protein YbaA (DUF1428 family)